MKNRQFISYSVMPLTFMLKIYKKIISPMLPGACRFYPTCSQYAIQSLERFGLIKGLYLSITRLLRCNPWFEGGFDPVPESNAKQNQLCKLEHK